MAAKYTAQEVAKYVVSRCYESGRPINNLKLQKMLYFLWIDYYRKTGGILFEDRMEAWKYGPVIPVVYWKYRSFVAAPICLEEKYSISQKDEGILSTLVDHYSKISVGQMIDKTHQKGGPWQEAFSEDASHKIEYKSIISYVDSHGQDASSMD
jgi:uncharacterized phage-associated protein